MENEKALSEYIALLEDSKKLSRMIYAKLNRMPDRINPDDINYGHVGDIIDIEQQLSDINNKLKGFLK